MKDKKQKDRLYREDYFTCPIYFMDKPEWVKKLNKASDPYIKKCTDILPKGSLVVFPSFVWHRVCPVKKGSRYSLVIWNLGWPFK